MKKPRLSIRNSRIFFPLLGLLVVMAISSVISPDFTNISNMVTILRQASVLLVLSAGLTAVLLMGEIDLSVSATAALVGCVGAIMLKKGVPTFVVVPLGMLMGATIGLFNGFLVSIIRLPSFVATYATNWILKGLAVILMSGQIIFGLPDSFTFLGTGYIFGKIPFIIIIMLIVVAICFIFLQRTTYGKDIYFCGSNSEAARYSGINTVKNQFVVFMMSSMFAGFAGLLITARLNAAEAAMGDIYGLNTIAAVVIGGTSMLGGEGGVVGTMIGAILLTLIVNIMNLIGITSLAQPMCIGLVIIAVVLLDSSSKNIKKQKKKKEQTVVS